ncbi:hypothetical protein LOTGIDRAFT_58567, partial [Lottia gigantea]
GDEVTHYIIEKRDADSDKWEKVAKVPRKTTAFDIKNLPAEGAFSFRIFAENPSGISEPVELRSPVKLQARKGKPSPPAEAPEILEVGPHYVSLSWKPPESDGGSPITGYFVERSDASGRSWIPVNKVAVQDLNYRVNDLFEGNQYEFRVRAENAKGVSEPS